jgi:hypothetical protein
MFLVSFLNRFFSILYSIVFHIVIPSAKIEVVVHIFEKSHKTQTLTHENVFVFLTFDSHKIHFFVSFLDLERRDGACGRGDRVLPTAERFRSPARVEAATLHSGKVLEMFQALRATRQRPRTTGRFRVFHTNR